MADPVYADDFPDPFVLVTDSGYYAHATNRGSNAPALWSADLTTWVWMGDAMPKLPTWAVSGRHLTWSPSVMRVGERYVLLYTARDRSSGRQCIGRAESVSPGGPFVDRAFAPFICQADMGGSIDPSFVRNPYGGLYVIWKNDGNCCGQPVMLWAQKLSPDGRQVRGERARLLERDQPWEGPLIEAPTMWEENGRWHLLYSANMWDSQLYSIGYAECDTPMGPCRKVGTGRSLNPARKPPALAEQKFSPIEADAAGLLTRLDRTAGRIPGRRGQKFSIGSYRPIRNYPRSGDASSNTTACLGTDTPRTISSASLPDPTPSTTILRQPRCRSTVTLWVPGTVRARLARCR